MSTKKAGGEADSASAAEYNLRFYNQGRSVPEDAKKPIRAGRLKGMTDVNPMWRMKRLTEIFGPVGFGWRYEVSRLWTEQYGDTVKCFCDVLLYVRDPETKEWSAAIPGNGGSTIVSVEGVGQTKYVSDEGYKMALTDALSIAMKPLGIGADIWYGAGASGHNESKYEQYTTQQPAQQPPQQPPQQPMQQPAQQPPQQPSEAVLKQAIEELQQCKSRAEVNTAWGKWTSRYHAMGVQNGKFHNAAVARIKELQ